MRMMICIPARTYIYAYVLSTALTRAYTCMYKLNYIDRRDQHLACMCTCTLESYIIPVCAEDTCIADGRLEKPGAWS